MAAVPKLSKRHMAAMIEQTSTPSQAAPPTSVGGRPAIELRGITKRFPGVVANDDITLDILPGEIHVLLGENGAGKSTLIGILAGLQQPDAGTISVHGQPVRIGSPAESLALGIGTVFQHVQLVPSLTVLENLMLGGSSWRPLHRQPAHKRFRELSDLLGVAIDPNAQVGRLALGEQQQVEIMHALWRGGSVLILDEPTSMLTPQGVHHLSEVMKRLRDNGVAIIFITHKMREACALGDRISVLRLGRVVGSIDKGALAAMNERQITDRVVELMFGQDGQSGRTARLVLEEQKTRTGGPIDRSAEPLLRLRDVTTAAQPGECAAVDIGFDLWPGEVLGIAGVDGNGQKHLAEVLAGQRAAIGGSILLRGAEIAGGAVADRRTQGITYITDDRHGEGTIGAFSVATNLVVKDIGTQPLWRHGISQWDRIHRYAREQIRRHDIRTPSEQTAIAKLSGGNIQKVLLARELTQRAALVIFNKPTYGLDLQNTQLARERIVEVAARGVAVIVISNELDELAAVSDRIGVMFQGRLNGIVANDATANRKIGLLMTGAAA
jgi:simple sugar transport system ATP-binding protein